MNTSPSWDEIIADAQAAASGDPIDDRPVDLAETKSEVERLAGLDALAYERERAAAAKRLGLCASVLDEAVTRARPKAEPEADGDVVETPEAWPEPVDGAALAEEVRGRLKAHVVFGSAGDADTAALWIFGTYLMDTWRLWPRLMITSPTKQCGKSTLLEVIDALAWRGLIVSNTKSAGVFRAIEAWRPTMLFDEADTWMKEDQELAGILNSGHTRRTARVIRVQEKAGELTPTLFSTWAPMVIAGIGSQRDTLTSRSVLIGLRRKLADETVERLPFDLHERMVRVRRQLTRWTADHAVQLGAMAIEPPECGNDRQRDNFTPLWRIAHALGGVWPDRIAAAYAAHGSGNDDDNEPAGVMLLRDVAGIFAERRADRLQSIDLVGSLTVMEDRPWAEWKHGRPLTSQTVAKLLKPFEVKQRPTRSGSQVFRAYHRADIDAAFARYAAQAPKSTLPSYLPEKEEEISPTDKLQAGGRNSSTSAEIKGNQEGNGVTRNRSRQEGFEALDDPNNPEAWR